MNTTDFDPIFAMPKSVALNNTLSPRARLLYGHIESLSYKTGYCWASNSYLAETFAVTDRSIRRDLRSLVDAKLIDVEIENETERKIYPRTQMATPRTAVSYPPRHECPTPPDTGVHISTQDEVHKGKKKAPANQLTKTELVSQCKQWASNWRRAIDEAPPEITAAVQYAFGSWMNAGSQPEREWSFVQTQLMEGYLDVVTPGEG